MFADISNIHNNYDLVYILTAVTIVDLIIIYIARNTRHFGKEVNTWYDKFSLAAIILDVLIIVIGFIVTRYLFYALNLEFSPELFIIIALTVQVVHDYLLYEFVIKPFPEGQNQMIDVYKNYAKEHGYKIILVDSAMVLGSAVLAMYLKNKEFHETTTLLILGLYAIPYLLYQKPV